MKTLSELQFKSLKYWRDGPFGPWIPHHRTNQSLDRHGFIDWDYDGYVLTEEGETILTTWERNQP